MASSAALPGATLRRSHGGHRGGHRGADRVAQPARLPRPRRRRRRGGRRVKRDIWRDALGSPGSRSPFVDWYLQYLDAKSPGDLNNPHPFGQIPALRDGDVEVFESGAILMYIADCYGLDTPAKRADANKWVVQRIVGPGAVHRERARAGADSGARRAESPKALTRLESVLSQREFLSGDAFGVADVAVASYLLFVPIFFADVSFARWPNTARYMGRCVVRPAYSKAFGGRTAAYLAERIESWVA